MIKSDFEFLKKLTEAPGPSGCEKLIRDLIIEKISPFVSSLRIDKIGNLIATKGNGENLLITAHMDEVGFMATKICEDGLIKFSPIGGISPAALPAKRVYFPKSDCKGVIGAKPIHLNKEKEAKITFSDLYIDIGSDSKTETESMVSQGDIALFDTKTEVIDEKNKMMKGKAIDNRLGCFLLCKLLANPKFQNVTCVFTVQEEIGLAGASAFVNQNKFSYGIALDVTTPNDLPGIKGPKCVCALEKGPVISFADGRCIYDNDLISTIFRLLKNHYIKCQTKAMRTGGNDAGALQQEGYGMKAISISIPCRFIHGPVGIFCENDLDETERALMCILNDLREKGELK